MDCRTGLIYSDLEAALEAGVPRKYVKEVSPHVPVRVGQRVRANEPCPCGSGKKFKRCCRQEAAHG
jgi:uncharacterized protein YecA (UPF0149 family)